MEHNNFILDLNRNTGQWRLWKFDASAKDPLSNDPCAHGELGAARCKHEWTPVGSYLLERDFDSGEFWLWETESIVQGKFNGTAHQHGKFGDITKADQLISFGNFVLKWTPSDGKYSLLNFDPQSKNPLPNLPDFPSRTGSWASIRSGHQLIPVGHYVIDWEPESAQYRLWCFDPEAEDPLPGKPLNEGDWGTKWVGLNLVPIAGYVLVWGPQYFDYWLYEFNPVTSDPLPNTWIAKGSFGFAFDRDHQLIGLQTLKRVPAQDDAAPGTIEFMQKKIKHVVYYMLENRSFDHVCGWLYEHEQPSKFIGKQGKFDGASTEYFNVDQAGKKVHLRKFNKGLPVKPEDLNCPQHGAYHGFDSVIEQLYQGSESSYLARTPPPMTGFVLNNGTDEMMETYTPNQLPIVNGLAREFAISDAWFCSLPGPTDVNRAFSLTGSSFGRVTNFESGRIYRNWPNHTHRPSIWKVLWSNGFDDWKIYSPDTWIGHCYTEQLFLKGQIPTVDANRTKYVQSLAQFKIDAASGTLPRFSFLEPTWLDADDQAEHPANCYHPPQDLVPGEIELNKIYEALKNSPQWEDTLLIITFDEHGGIYDHVSPPFGARPYPHDQSGVFSFDLFGVRVPTILVSPWIEKGTVFRSHGPASFDSTSFLSTLLEWYGIPRSRWCLGDRCSIAPTFESTFTLAKPRKDKPTLIPPAPLPAEVHLNSKASDLHKVFAARILCHGQTEPENSLYTQEALRELEQAETLGEVQAVLSKAKLEFERDRKDSSPEAS